MADGKTRTALLHAHSSKNIGFGHFGTAYYDDSAQQWNFLRKDLTSTGREECDVGGYVSIEPVGHANQVISASHLTTGLNTRSGRISANVFLKTLPEAAPVLSQSRSDNQPFVTAQNSEKPELSRLVFGSALVLGSEDAQSGLQTTPIAAYVSSIDLNKLVLLLLDRQYVMVDLEIPQSAYFPHLSKSQSASWTSENGSILQVCFSARSSSQEATWLAVRQATATTIFQPLFHKTTSTPGRSSLDHNLVIQIPISRSGGVQHAHVEFHPADPHQLAIVDGAGSWSIWKIKGSRSRSAHILYCIQLVTSSSFVPQTSQFEVSDGWHCIRWQLGKSGQFDRIMVANRHVIALFNVQGLLLCESNVKISTRDGGLVLDIVSTRTHATLFVLTTTYILILNFVSTKPTVLGSSVAETVVVPAFFSHFRASADSTLKLNALSYGNKSLLFLTSAMHEPITVLEILREDKPQSTLYRISDPVLLKTHEASGMRCITIQSVATEWHEVGDVNCNDTFIKVFFQDYDENISEVLYTISGIRGMDLIATDGVPVPHRRVSQHKSTYRVFESSSDDDLNEFIVSDPDRNDDDGYGIQDEPTTLAMAPSDLDADRRNADSSYDLRICDLSQIYDAVTISDTISGPLGKIGVHEFVTITQNALNAAVGVQRFPRLMSELSGANVYISEIEADSHKLSTWLKELQRPSAKSGNKQNPSVLLSAACGDDTMIATYEELAQLWMPSLSSEIPDRLRVQRERLLRHIALDQYLSSIHIRQPVSGSLHRTRHVMASSQITLDDLSLQAEVSESDLLPESSTSLQSQATETTQTDLPVLSSYVKFERPSPKSGKEFTLVNELLSHLPPMPAADPDAYNFADAELELSLARNEVMTQNLNSKARRKAEKVARGRKRQYEKQAQVKKVAFETTSVLPSIMSSQLPIRGIQSSQARPFPSSQPSMENAPQISMSQPERGVYGNREVKKAKVKAKGGRQKGF